MIRSRIYTKTGDDGTTGLLYGGRVSKGDELVDAYVDIDEVLRYLNRLSDLPFVLARHAADGTLEPASLD